MVARYRTIDGLRGLAALAVVLFHLGSKMRTELQAVFPDWLNLIIEYGYLGVPVFFVISGFVIALSVNGATINLKYAGNFALRRSIRLDLTYWASIFTILLLMTINHHFLGGDTPLPSATEVLLHLFYLQDLTGVDPVISVVYWTLCLEVQLYLFFLISVWLSQAAGRMCQLNSHTLHLSGILMLGIYSLLVEQEFISLTMPGLFVAYWHYFLIGVLLSHVVQGRSTAAILLMLWLAVEIAFLLAGEIRSYPVAGIFVGFFLFTLWRWFDLDSLLSSVPFQYLGSISYTLYLVHPDFGWKAISIGKQFFEPAMSAAAALAVFLSSLAIALAAAHFFHVLFEKPSLKLAKELKHASLGQIISRFSSTLQLRFSRPARSIS